MTVNKQTLILEIDLLDAIIGIMQKTVRTYNGEINYSYLMHLSEILKYEATKIDDMIIKQYDQELSKELETDEEE